MVKGIVISTIILIVCAQSVTCDVKAETRGTTYFWFCNNATELCEKTKKPYSPNIRHGYTSFKVCRLTCGNYAGLWPKPTISTRLSKDLVKVHPSAIKFETDITNENYLKYLQKIKHLFLDNIYRECGNCSKQSNDEIVVHVTSHQTSTDLHYEVDESYVLTIKTEDTDTTISIVSKTIYGVRHGLETLSQLIVSDRLSPNQKNDYVSLVTVSSATIVDRPTYLHRGLLLDTARNYLPVKTIKRQIDAMAHSKMNVLHWHATDSQSFPIKLPNVQILAAYGAYSEDQVYTAQDIADLLSYAKIRGVRIILEIDSPSHAGNGWQWGEKADLGRLAVCVNKTPWRQFCIQPPCGQLNPVNENLYSILGQLYGDIINIFPKGEMFHMGGDEVFFPCWNSSSEISNYLDKHGRNKTADDFLWLWSKFQEKILKEYDTKAGNSHTNIILWSSGLTNPEVISKYLNVDRYIVQTWVKTDDILPYQLLDLGYRLIISTKNAWYLDHGFWGTTTYYPWRVVYKNELPAHVGVLGGEICMWGELVDDSSIDSRIWPRAAAAAERLWSDPDDTAAEAEPRFYAHRNRLVDRGIMAEALAPTWCIQNEGQCT